MFYLHLFSTGPSKPRLNRMENSNPPCRGEAEWVNSDRSTTLKALKLYATLPFCKLKFMILLFCKVIFVIIKLEIPKRETILPGESRGQRSPVGCRPQGRTESGTVK